MPLFDRIGSVLIGERGSETALNVIGLRISFDVTKTADKEANGAKVRIYNLNPDQRSAVETARDAYVIVKAGYAQETGAEVLYSGDISFATNRREAPDWVTEIESNDGQAAFSTSKVSLGFGEGTSAKQVIRAVLNEIPLAKRSAVVDNAIAQAVDKQFANGFSAVGNAFDALTRITEELSLEWSVQDREIKIVAAGGSDGSRAVVLAPGKGMIGSPQRRRSTDDKRAVFDGWLVRSLLQPKIEPAGLISIEAEAIEPGAAFRVEKVTHKGDTFGDDWYTEVEVTDA